MPSIQSRLLVFMIKYGGLISGRKRTTHVDWDTDIPALRAEVERSAGSFGKLPEGLSLEEIDIDGLHAYWILPPGGSRERVLLYFHGGGYVVGSARSHIGVTSKYVKGSGAAALLIDYGLAPEHPYPEGLNDALKAYRWLQAQGIPAGRIVLGGDSGGGGLCLSALVALRDAGDPSPAAAFALSPWADLTNSSESVRTNRVKDGLSWTGSQEVFAKYYAGENDPRHPHISPVYADLHGLPPLRLYAGGDETLRDDSVRFAEKAQADGVDVRLTVGEGLFHCYPAVAPLIPEATQAMAEICTFIQERTA